MYMLFAGSTYYPCGGCRDFEGTFVSIEAAIEAAANISCDWWHVADSSGTIVDEGYKS